MCWFAAGRVLIRFLRAALEAKSEPHVNILQTEVEFIRSVPRRAHNYLPTFLYVCDYRTVISGIGDTVPHASEYSTFCSGSSSRPNYTMHSPLRQDVGRLPGSSMGPGPCSPRTHPSSRQGDGYRPIAAGSRQVGLGLVLVCRVKFLQYSLWTPRSSAALPIKYYIR